VRLAPDLQPLNQIHSRSYIMAKNETPSPAAEKMTPGVPAAPRQDMPLPDDPGGSHTKGYSADPPGPEPDVPQEGPIPLAEGPAQHPAVHVPERDKHVQPTGRAKEKENRPKDRLKGADR
jgi:hypothetical protein